MGQHLKERSRKFLGKDYWLGSEHSAVNINRFWLYLFAIGLSLCAVCLVRAIERA